jgi:hypothetical protein
LSADPRKDAPPGAVPEEDWVPEDDAVIGRAFRWSLVVAGVAVVLVLAGLGVAKLVRADPVDRAIAADAPLVVERAAVPPTVAWSDATADSGVAFVHHNGAYGEKLLPETMATATRTSSSSTRRAGPRVPPPRRAARSRCTRTMARGSSAT